MKGEQIGERGTLVLKWVFFAEFCLLSQSSVWALLLCRYHGEKHRLLCNKIIQEKDISKKFFGAKKQTANYRIHEVLRSTTQPHQPSILEPSQSFYGSGKALALSPNYSCEQTCFLMNG